MAEGLKLIVSADTKQAEKALNDFVLQSQHAGQAAGDAMGKGLDRAIPAIKNIPKQVKPAVKAISYLGDSIETLEAKLGARKEFIRVAKTTTEISFLNAEIRELEGEIKRVKAIGSPTLANLSTGATKAGFGFNTIAKGANNAFGAIRKIAFILPGIGLAGIFGAIFSLFDGFGSKADKAADGVSRVNKELEDAAKKQEEFSKAIDKAAGSLISQESKLKDLRAIMLSTSDATVQLTKATINQGLARLLFDQKNEALQKVINAGIQKELELRKQANPFSQSGSFRNNPQIAALEKEIKLRQSLGDPAIGLQKQLKAAKEISSLEFVGQDDIQNINSLSDGLGGFFKQFLDEGNKAKKTTDDVIAQAKRLATFLDKNTQFEVFFEVDETKSEEVNKQAARDFIAKAKSFIEKQTPEFKFKPLLRTEFKFINDGKFLQLIRDQAGIEATKTYKEVKKEWDDVVKRAANSNPLVIKTNAELEIGRDRNKQKEEFDKQSFSGFKLFDFPDNPTGPDGKPLFTQMEFGARKTAAAINQTLAPAFSNMFAAIKAGDNPLKAFFDGIGQAVEQLIQKLIAAAIQAAILSALIPGGGAGGFGSIFKGILGFASGGIVSGPTLALIGEGSGTSRNNPEVVAPLDQLRGMLAGLAPQQQGGGRLTASIRGNTILLSNNRTNRSNRRLGAR